MYLILWNLHSTWTKRATFLWQAFIVSCSKRNIFIWSSRYSCLGNCLVWKINIGEKPASRLNANGSICWRSIVFAAFLIDHGYSWCNPTWLARDSKLQPIKITHFKKNKTIIDSQEYKSNALSNLRLWLTTPSRVIMRMNHGGSYGK